ncbi:MAG: ankyrin repeat domain-containing protein [Pseudomonadaceae bacterium]|nr:MAG: ankyrin repeat domain-containing protein [Pseudomonadaceae bacterium]
MLLNRLKQCTILSTGLLLAACVGLETQPQTPASRPAPVSQQQPTSPLKAIVASEARFQATLIDSAALEQRDSNGMTLLHWAASRGNLEQVESLIAAGLDINARDTSGRVPLHLAALAGDRDPGGAKLQALLQAGAEIDVRSTNEIDATPLITASRFGNAEHVRLLLEAGADPLASTDSGMTSLMRAARYPENDPGLAKMQRLLMAGSDVNAIASENWTVLRTAARYNSADAVRLLLDAGSDPNTSNPEGWGALHIAARYGSPEMIEALLVAGSITNQVTNDGQTPLHLATRNNAHDITKLLLAAGANPNIRNNLGWTPLHRAISHGEAPHVGLLLAGGADPELTTSSNTTPYSLTNNREVPDRELKQSYFAAMGVAPDSSAPSSSAAMPLASALASAAIGRRSLQGASLEDISFFDAARLGAALRTGPDGSSGESTANTQPARQALTNYHTSIMHSRAELELKKQSRRH